MHNHVHVANEASCFRDTITCHAQETTMRNSIKLGLALLAITLAVAATEIAMIYMGWYIHY